MILKRIYLSFFVAILCVGIGTVKSYGQWGAPYANSWISNGKPYVKISITQSGIYKIPFDSLPSGFPVDKPANFKIFHLGKEISIVSTDNREILFYAVPNDGSSDSLLYRPMNSRINPYSSIYSTKGAYFLTVGDNAGKRAAKESLSTDASLTPLPYHLQSDVQVNSTEYSHSTQIYIKPDFINSFFEQGASKTGARLLNSTLYSYPYQLKSSFKSSSAKPTVKVLLHGRSNNARGVEIYIGKNATSLRKVNTINLVNFIAQIFTFDLADDDIADDGSVVFGVKSISTVAEDRFSIGFVNITYPQSYTVQSSESLKKFTLPSTTVSSSRIQVAGTSGQYGIYKITDINNPVVISGQAADFTISRKAAQSDVLLLTKETTTITKSQLSSVSFQQFTPSSYDYIIVTNEGLEASAKTYAAYRASGDGGGYRPLVVKIKDLYNQFNYGEVSPLAIRRFVDYMISDGNQEKYLLLFGKSITFVERMLPELDEDVPAIGYPGSDILLVEGLGSAQTDLPAIPVGRISAVNSQQAANYLQKVKDYEHNVTGTYGWRKKVLHMNGGKTAEEINQFKNTLASLTPLIENGSVGGDVTAFSKQSLIEVEEANITPEVNSGVGMISYIGHGSQYVTDYDMGFITAASRGYNNTGKYPFMYFNGCGVGNIFNGRLNTDLNASDKIPLSMDWLLTDQKGSIAIIANSFESYLSPTIRFLDKLYSNLFNSDKFEKLPIGKVQKEVILEILSEANSFYDIANIHQSLLQGDPALHLISVDHADYSVDPTNAVTLYSESASTTIEKSKTIRAAIVMANEGRFIKDEIVPVQMTYYFDTEGTKETISQSVVGIRYMDTLIVSFNNQGKALVRIDIKVDPSNLLAEMSKTNNNSQFFINWDVAKQQFVYSGENVVDVIAPTLDVTFNQRKIKNNEIISPNPVIRFTIQDDRLLQSDSTLLDVYIKPCGDDNCDFKRVSYAGNDLFKLSAVSSTSVMLTYSSNLSTDGIYELLVNVKDKSGNLSKQPYRIVFQLAKSTETMISVISSPNPASDYVRFETKIDDIEPLESIQWLIYDVRGILITSKDIIPNGTSTNEWYWYPNVGSGLYIYKIRAKRSNGQIDEKSGKLAVIK